MATPVGPAAPDPHDPDLWEEWYRDDAVDDHDDDVTVGHHLSTPVRVVAVVVLVAMVVLIVLAG